MHLPFYMTPDAEVVIFGHTHVFECDFKNRTLFLNPGETCAREQPFSSAAMLEITDNSLKVTHYLRPIGDNHFEERHYSFERS